LNPSVTGNGLIRAAGGLLWRTTADGREIALVHRPRYGDWSLPKGKVQDAESLESAALREVAEETGCHATLGAPAGATSYRHDGKPKTVWFWHMEYAGEIGAPDRTEVDRVEWMSLGEALRRLDHENEIALLTAATRSA
jgi:8-oxo-dGTP diphosphatase